MCCWSCVPGHVHVQACTQEGGYIKGYIVDILYSFMKFSMIQSLHPVSSFAYVRIIVEF